MVKIGWVHEIPAENQGGAELTNKEMIEEGIRRGYEIVYMMEHNVDLSCDFYIINNVYFMARKKIYEIIHSGKPFVKYEHDMGFCHYRDGDCWSHCGDNKCGNWYYEELFMKSKLNIFLSPLHYEKHAEMLKSIKLRPYHIQPSPVTVPEMGTVEKTPNTTCYVGQVSKPKGADRLIQYAKRNPQIQFHIVGQVHYLFEEAFKKLMNCRMYGHVKRGYALRVMAKCEYFYHEPHNLEAYGRTVAEAHLLGCKLITNERVGVMSYEDPFDTIEKAKEAPTQFWDKIEEVMKDENIIRG